MTASPAGRASANSAPQDCSVNVGHASAGVSHCASDTCTGGRNGSSRAGHERSTQGVQQVPLSCRRGKPDSEARRRRRRRRGLHAGRGCSGTEGWPCRISSEAAHQVFVPRRSAQGFARASSASPQGTGGAARAAAGTAACCPDPSPLWRLLQVASPATVTLSSAAESLQGPANT